MPFFHWKCSDCGKGGAVRHTRNATQGAIRKRAGEMHAQKSPECHGKEVQRQLQFLRVIGNVTPRDKHILISARLKRRMIADAIREMRGRVPAPPERQGDAWDAWLAKVGPKRESVRQHFIEARKQRNGYAFT